MSAFSVERPLPSPRLFAVAFIVLITCACAPRGNVRAPSAPPDPIAQANALLNGGNYGAAALAFDTLAANAGPGERNQLLALAALAYQDAGDEVSADAVLARFDSDAGSDGALVATARVCSMVAAGEVGRAYALAVRIDPAALTPYQRGRHARCFGAAALATDHISDAATAWTSSYRYPSPSDQAESIARSTWRAVSRLPQEPLQSRAKSADGVVSGWYTLALIAQQSMFDAAQFSARTAQWEQQYTQHPAVRLLQELLERSESISVRPRKVALLLPFDDSLRAAATAIRDGFITAWYLDRRTELRPELKVYSSASADIESIAARAVAEGAEFIVGPLRKGQVDRLRADTELASNVLALNLSAEHDSVPRAGFYQFALTPDDEVAAVAERAVRTGQKALLIAPDTPWGKRLAAIYNTNWTRLGGVVAAEIYYQDDSQAYVEAVKRGLNIDLSEARSAEVRRTLNLPLHFEPRRRADVDLILLAARPDNARQLLPQLRYFRAETIPVFATSHVFNGRIAQQPDSDLNGITFADMPWLFGATDHESFNLVRRNFSANFGGFSRLYAFGIDAYRMLPYLAKMRLQPNLRVPGVTGDLWMDDHGVVHRKLAWLQFIDGRPAMLDHRGGGRAY